MSSKRWAEVISLGLTAVVAALLVGVLWLVFGPLVAAQMGIGMTAALVLNVLVLLVRIGRGQA